MRAWARRPHHDGRSNSNGMLRAPYGLAPHVSRDATLPILLTVDDAAELPRTTRRGDLRDDRSAATTQRNPPPRAATRQRFATLAGPEARAIVRGVVTMSITI